jgi:hypothetical protein
MKEQDKTFYNLDLQVSQELKALEVDEPLLKENPRRFVILPIQVPFLPNIYFH